MSEVEEHTAPGTGVDAVDRVIETLGTLADRPVAEHVAVFEQAHRDLRAALDPASPVAPGAGPVPGPARV